MQFHWWMFQHPAYIDALEQLVRLRQEGVIGADRRHQLRYRSPAPDREARDTGRLQPGLVLAARPARRRCDERVLPRRTASGCSPMARLQAASSPTDGVGRARAIRDPGLEQVEVQALHRCRSAAGRVLQTLLAALDAIARKHGVSISNVATRWVMRAAGGRRRDRRRAARRERASRRQSAPVRIRARCRRHGTHRGGAGGSTARCRAIAATSTGNRRSSRHPAISAITCELAQGVRGRAGARRGPAA